MLRSLQGAGWPAGCDRAGAPDGRLSFCQFPSVSLMLSGQALPRTKPHTCPVWGSQCLIWWHLTGDPFPLCEINTYEHFPAQPFWLFDSSRARAGRHFLGRGKGFWFIEGKERSFVGWGHGQPALALAFPQSRTELDVGHLLANPLLTPD